MIELLLGFYLGTASAVFWVVLFFCILGANKSDIWKPFVYALFWPITVAVLIISNLSRVGRY